VDGQIRKEWVILARWRVFQEKEFLEIGVGILADGRRHVGIESRGPKGVFSRTGK